MARSRLGIADGWYAASSHKYSVHTRACNAPRWRAECNVRLFLRLSAYVHTTRPEARSGLFFFGVCRCRSPFVLSTVSDHIAARTCCFFTCKTPHAGDRSRRGRQRDGRGLVPDQVRFQGVCARATMYVHIYFVCIQTGKKKPVGSETNFR